MGYISGAMDTHPIKLFRESQVPPMSQDALAEQIGVDRVTVARWESGDRKPDVNLLPKIVEITGIPARDLRPDLAERASIFGGAA